MTDDAIDFSDCPDVIPEKFSTAVIRQGVDRARTRRFSYKGYTGVLLPDGDSTVFSRTVSNIRDVVTFEGDTLLEAEQAFRDSVDDYLAFCQRLQRKATLSPQ